MGETSKENVKKRHPLSLEDRVKILDRLAAGERQIDIAASLKISPSTISSILRRKETILTTKEALELRGGNLKVKKFKKSNFANKEDELYDWFIKRRNAGLPVKGFHLQEKALQMNEEEREKNLKFKASNGWLHRFKKRKGIRMLANQSSQKSLDTIANDKFKLEFNEFIKISSDSPNFIYNCNEIALEWKKLPIKNLDAGNKHSSTGREQIENRITVMSCSSASGSHKIPLYVIGTAIQSRCFQGIKELPVHYDDQQKPRMNKQLMLRWYERIFLPEVQKKHDYSNNPNLKIVLIMDNDLFHPSVEEFNSISDICTVMFLPTNVTSSIQPLNQDIVTTMKMNYKKLFLSHIYVKSAASDIEAFLESFTLLDAVKCCVKAWDDVSVNCIRNCWKNLIPLNDLLEENVDLNSFHAFLIKLPGFSSYSRKNALQYLNCDSLNDENELEVVCKVEDLSDNEINVNEDETNTLFSRINIHEGLDSLNTFIKYYEKSEDCCKSTLKVLQTLSLNMVEKIIAQKYT